MDNVKAKGNEHKAELRSALFHLLFPPPAHPGLVLITNSEFQEGKWKQQAETTAASLSH